MCVCVCACEEKESNPLLINLLEGMSIFKRFGFNVLSSGL